MISYLIFVFVCILLEYKLSCARSYCSDINESITRDNFKMKDKSKFDIGDKSQISVSII